MALDDFIDPQRGDADVPVGARRVRRYECPCDGCQRSRYPFLNCYNRHDDRTFPVYGPPEPHTPRHAAPSQETAA